MTLWRRTRTEVAGAWRSLRYDLGRRETEESGEPAGPRQTFQDVTSTGLNTFGGAALTGGLHTSYGAEHARRPRRAVAVTAFGTLAVAGAAGSYFAVVNGLGALLDEQPAGAEPYPLAAAAPDGGAPEASNEGFGRGSAPSPGPVGADAVADVAPGTVRTVPHTLATTGTPAGRDVAPSPRRTTVDPTPPVTEPPSCCLAPPVPTPTAAPSTPDSPSPTPSPSDPDDEPASPEPTEDPATPDPEGSGGTDRAERAARTARN